MNLTWLEDFLALTATGNFSRAASTRHMTQPAFSRRIRALEEWLGTALFDRATHPVTLTDAGQWFKSVAQQTLARVACLPDEAQAVASASAATLRLAATHALSFTFLPAWLRSLEPSGAVGPIQLVSDVLQQCELQMQQARSQFLLCHSHPNVPGQLDPDRFRSVCIGLEVLLPVSAPSGQGAPLHALPALAAGIEDQTAVTHAGRLPLLAYSDESGIGRMVRAVRGAALERAGASRVFTAHLASVLKPMALDGRGIAWLPASMVADELTSGKLVRAGGTDWAVALEIRLFRSVDAALPAAEAFWRAAVAAQLPA